MTHDNEYLIFTLTLVVGKTKCCDSHESCRYQVLALGWQTTSNGHVAVINQRHVTRFWVDSSEST